MNTLIVFKQFVDEILQSNSRVYKEQVLEKYKDNKDIKYYLNFLYNPYITTGISDKKWEVIRTTTHGTSWYEGKYNSVKDILEYLRLNNTGRFETLNEVFAYMCLEIQTDLWDLYEALVTKNLQLGVDAKTINKVIPGLIPTFNVMLANKYFDNPAYVEGQEIAITTKIDGGRIIALKEHGVVSFYTRAGQRYEGLVDLEKEMQERLPDNTCLDGEITLLNSIGLTSKEQYKETMKITRRDGEKHGVKMRVFDYMTAEEFRAQKCDMLYRTRRNELFKAFASGIPDCYICTDVAIGCEPDRYYNFIIEFLNNKYTYFQILPYLYIGNDVAKITECLNEQVAKGEEGIMLNLLYAPYEFKRTSSLLKVKKMQDIDLPIVGFEEGTNRHIGRLGAVLVDYDGNIVKVGSGFSDWLRDEIWQHQDEWLGRTISIQYFEATCNQKGGKSLRFPVYLDYRTDK